MKIKLLKKSATIQLETKEEVEAFKLAVSYYMEMIYEEPDEGCSDYACDDLMNKINKKVEKDERV